MPRGRSTFGKRLKEQARQQKQRDKAERRVQRKQDKPDILQMRASGLKPGPYKLQWKVLASDGHMSNGDVPFTVK